jgi:cobalamin biosynthesis protein CobT
MRYIRASAGRAGLGVVWEDINMPRHDGKNIYLPSITYKTTEEELLMLMSSVDHEVAHDKFSSFDILKDNKGLLENKLLMFVWNFIEDSRVNTIEAQDYRGFREIWDQTTSKLIGNISDKAKKEPSEMTDMMGQLILWEADINKSLFPLCDATAKSLFDPLPKTLKFLETFSDRLVAAHKEKDKAKGSQMTFDIAIDILQINKEKEKKKEEERKAKGKEKGTEKEEEMIAKEEGGDPDKKKKEEAIDPKDKEFKILKAKVTKEDLDSITITPVNINTAGAKIGVNFDIDDLVGKSSSRPWDVTDFNDYIVVNYPKNEGDRGYFDPSAARYFIPSYDRVVGEKIATEESFAQQVRKLIQIRAKVQTQFGVKRGKLDQSRISRVCFKAPGLSERVFKNRIQNTTLDAAITVLIDMSGSMAGVKVLSACAAGLLMNEVSTTLNIPCEVLGFTDCTRATSTGWQAFPIMYIYKGFNDLKVSHDDFLRYFGYSSNTMLGNPDGENILWAYDRLLKRKEKNRILIVMSDGNPAATKGGSGLIPFTEQVIKEIENDKKVFIYGLGMLSDAVTRLYKYHSVVKKVEEIPHKLLELFEERIIKS